MVSNWPTTAAIWLVFEKILALSMPAGVLVDYL